MRGAERRGENARVMAGSDGTKGTIGSNRDGGPNDGAWMAA